MDANGEFLVQRALLRAFNRNERLTVCDVGAHVGRWSRSLLDAALQEGVQQVELHAFEPSASTFKSLEENLATFNGQSVRVELVQGALSNQCGMRTLYKPHEGAGSSSLERDERLDYPGEAVSTMTLDRYADLRGIAHINLLKIDAEGHDLAILEGAQRLLNLRALDVIQFEYNFRWILARRFLRDAFLLLEQTEYTIGKVTPKGVEFYRGWHPELETFREGNYLACLASARRMFPTVAWWNELAG
jgi:FkbM family methyltransferase